ncbi:DUF1310 family protein [Companilactobacillus sp. DQM5]|uniref:DUF1310 family protein n=1 Tax=Companilactobacillus sp. DQM5 TaxID=3463359 RepID=UPI0040594503
MNKKRKILIVILSLAIIVIGIGVKVHMDNVRFHEEMVRVVKSDKAQEVIKKEIIENVDKKAFTNEGKIHSFKIKYDTIKHNPMGGIDFEGYVNNDSKLEFDTNLDKYNDDLELGAFGESVELQKLMKKKLV